MNLVLFWPTLGIFTLGLTLIGTGFSLRDSKPGLGILWLGTLCMLSLVFLHVTHATSV
ncbi:hypothetical protein LCGC14_0063040 [marine sediment metagenome]|uniref:Uncharacterized protein n=1 Tax=marine sediment metagenome TaxID=412755 RepID=A0A0F9VMZ7_9ZZZZ